MKKFPAQTDVRPDPLALSRFAPIPALVNDILAELDPDGYTRALNALCAAYKPACGEIYVLQVMANAMWRTSGCWALETRLLNRGMEIDRVLLKLSRYEVRLSTAYIRCVKIMSQRIKNRKYPNVDMTISLRKRKPCTSVIQ